MPGIFGNDAGIDLVVGIGAADQILHEQLLALRMFDEIGMKQVEGLAGHRLVVVPPDVILSVGVAHDELVLRRAARVLAGACDERALRRQFGFAPADGFLIKTRWSKIVKDCGEFLQS